LCNSIKTCSLKYKSTNKCNYIIPFAKITTKTIEMIKKLSWKEALLVILDMTVRYSAIKLLRDIFAKSDATSIANVKLVRNWLVQYKWCIICHNSHPVLLIWSEQSQQSFIFWWTWNWYFFLHEKLNTRRSYHFLSILKLNFE